MKFLANENFPLLNRFSTKGTTQRKNRPLAQVGKKFVAVSAETVLMTRNGRRGQTGKGSRPSARLDIFLSLVLNAPR